MITETLKKLGITDVSVLEPKTQRKISDYNRLVKSPIGNDKEGNPSPKKQARLDDLVEDIILEAQIHNKKNSTRSSGSQSSGNGNSKATEAKVNNQNKQQSNNASVKTEEKGILEKLLGF